MDVWVPDSRLDRVDAERQDAERVVELWRAPDATLVAVDGRSDLLSDQGGRALRQLPCRGGYDPDRHYLIGTVAGRPYFVVDAKHLYADPDSGLGETASLRDLAAHLPDSETDIATTALALVNWHRVAPHCGQCGAVTQVRAAGHVRYCPECDRERFPRTDPAVIVAVLAPDGRLLLGHHVGWEATRVSLLAGFVEAGESLEQAVRREVLEEARLELGDLRYVGSQPWPFPRSLMLGFVAEALGTDVQVDGEEIQWAGFYSVDELRAKVAAGELTLPMSASIASRIIAQWLAGDLAL